MPPDNVLAFFDASHHGERPIAERGQGQPPLEKGQPWQGRADVRREGKTGPTFGRIDWCGGSQHCEMSNGGPAHNATEGS